MATKVGMTIKVRMATKVGMTVKVRVAIKVGMTVKVRMATKVGMTIKVRMATKVRMAIKSTCPATAVQSYHVSMPGLYSRFLRKSSADSFIEFTKLRNFRVFWKGSVRAGQHLSVDCGRTKMPEIPGFSADLALIPGAFRDREVAGSNPVAPT